jgi:hypothetical protein
VQHAVFERELLFLVLDGENNLGMLYINDGLRGA